ncbi:MAG: hypothetical protein JRH15_06835 [Deltaproteobacteria bacterium]|nr:hypothetical protein [Deltaproteobacteria bacterium]
MKLGIDQYSFGRMIVSGRAFTSDLILYPDGRIQDNWWREQGHRLVPADIAAVLDAAPRRLVIGTGASGLMTVSERVMALCRERGVEVDVSPTATAATQFNKATAAGISVAACFHLTC